MVILPSFSWPTRTPSHVPWIRFSFAAVVGWVAQPARRHRNTHGTSRDSAVKPGDSLRSIFIFGSGSCRNVIFPIGLDVHNYSTTIVGRHHAVPALRLLRATLSSAIYNPQSKIPNSVFEGN